MIPQCAPSPTSGPSLVRCTVFERKASLPKRFSSQAEENSIVGFFLTAPVDKKHTKYIYTIYVLEFFVAYIVGQR